MKVRTLFRAGALLVMAASLWGCMTVQQMKLLREAKKAAEEAKKATQPKVGKAVRAEHIKVGTAVGKPRAGKAEVKDKTGKTITVDGEELPAPPEELKYPRKYLTTRNRIELHARSFSYGHPSQIRINNFLVNAGFYFIPKKTNRDKSYMEVGFELGYPNSTLKARDLGGYVLAENSYDSSLIIPYIAGEISGNFSLIDGGEAGYFEMCARIRLGLHFEEFEDVQFFDPDGAFWDDDDVSRFAMHTQFALTVSRMLGKPIPLEYVTPFAGLAVNMMVEMVDMYQASESRLVLWPDLVFGIRARPTRFFYAEFELIIGQKDMTYQISGGFIV
jgi:hypothetical protein